MLALLVALLLALLFGASAALTPAQTPSHATVMPPRQPPFTVGGRVPPVRAGAVTLRRGETLRFDPPVRVLVVNRLECAADTHRVRLVHSIWRVPDLPTGYYTVSGAGTGQLVRVQSHSAPCP